MQARIDTNVLKAVALFCAEKDLQQCFLGVHIKADTGTLRLSATNRHTLTTYTQEVDDEELQGLEVIVPKEAVALALTAHKKAAYISLDHNNGNWTLGGIPFEPIAGRWPDAQRAWPSTMDGKPCVVSPAYYSLITKATKHLKLGDNNFMLWHDTNMIVWEAGPLRGVIMGLRNHPHSQPTPSF